MNKSFSSSTPTPPYLQRPTSVTRHNTAAIIPLDYNYQTMSPSCYTQLYQNNMIYRRADSVSHTAGELDVSSQYNSLFGDPVPPPPPVEYLGSDFNSSQLFRPMSMDINSGEDVFGPTSTTTGQITERPRLFPTVPFGSTLSRRLSSPSTQYNLELLSAKSVSRLQPPDIQILPNSSGDSSTDPLGSPNFALLRPDDILTKPTLYESTTEPADVNEVIETLAITDAAGTREYTEAKRRVSNFSIDFKSNVGPFDQAGTDERPLSPKAFKRRDSNESYSSEDWFRPNTREFPDFCKMPKLRPSSKNIMSIKRNEMPTQLSPVAAMFNDSTGSSSGEERLLDVTNSLDNVTTETEAEVPERPPQPSPKILLDLRDDLQELPSQYIKQRQTHLSDSTKQNFSMLPPPEDPPPIPPAPDLEKEWLAEAIKREMSPVIMKNLVVTGGDHRVEQARLHKKTSFTILSDKSAQSSTAPTPSDLTQRTSPAKVPPKSVSGKPVAKPRYQLQRKSLSSTQMKLPQIQPLNHLTSDDSPRPSVQFDMTGRHSPSKMPQKGILQHRESITSSQEALPQAAIRSTTTLPSKSMYDLKHSSYETLPLITDPYRSSIPRLNLSTLELGKESAIFPPGALPRPLRHNPNPTRKQRGLLRVLNGDEILSRIPLPSNWVSMDDITFGRYKKPKLASIGLQKRRRSSSTSPERRSSTQTVSDRRSSNLSSVTTSDFSFRRPSITQEPQRRKPLLPSATTTPKRRQSVAGKNSLALGTRATRTKIAKPTTLSPIIGTPNKDSSTPQSPIHMTLPSLAPSETLSDTSRRESISRIPISNLRFSGSQPASRLNSRSNSPFKELNAQSGRTSRATSSRTPSRATLYNGNSRSPSRSTSRASTRPISQDPSRASSRISLRLDQTKPLGNSRSNSRASVRSTSRSGSVSLSLDRKRSNSVANRRKSVSLSPKVNRITRRPSISPANRNGKTPVRGRTKTRTNDQKTQQKESRIPRRSLSNVRKSISPPKTKVPVLKTKQISSITNKPMSRGKEPTSAKKAPTSVQKPVSSVKRTPSSVGKQTTAAKKESSNLQKPGSNIKRETSNLQKPLTNKREISSLSLKKGGVGAIANNKKSNSVKKSGNSASVTKTDSKVMSKSDVSSKSKLLESSQTTEVIGGTVSKPTLGEKLIDSAVAVAVATAVGSGLNETAVNEATGSVTDAINSGTGAIKRQPSTMTLMRMGSRMSLLSKKRPDSSLSKKITEEDLHETETQMQTDIDVQKLSVGDGKVSASGIPLSPEQVAALPAAILEKSQKTLENIQKTVTVATDEIHKTINANLTDLKSLETDVGKMSADSTASPTSSVATVVENKAATNSDSMPVQKSPLPNTQPIEADVSVVNPEALPNAASNVDASERVSARAISVLPEVESESANFQNFELGIADKGGAVNAASTSAEIVDTMAPHNGSGDDFKVDAKRRSPDGQGGSTVGSGEK